MRLRAAAAIVLACGGLYLVPSAMSQGSGTRIAWYSDSTPYFGVMGADGRQRHIVGRGVNPSLSSNGRTIVFERDISYRDGYVNDLAIFRVNANGTGLRQLTHPPDAWNSGFWWAAISPDGAQVVASNAPHDYALTIMSADGSDQRQLTHGEEDLYPSFAPNGRQIVFQRSVVGGDVLATIDVDGTNEQNLTAPDGPNDYVDPVFSPDGSTIMYLCDTSICMINADGSDERTVVSNAAAQPEDSVATRSAVFSPTGDRIAWTCDRDNAKHPSICQANSDGSDPQVILRDAHVSSWAQ